MRIAYVTEYDPLDKSQWSGLGFAIFKALESQGAKMVAVGPLADNFKYYRRIAGKLALITGRSFDFNREAVVARSYARQVALKLSSMDFDAVFSPGSIAISRLECVQPIFLWSDATFGSLIQTYAQYRNLSSRSVRSGHRTEKLALDRCARAFFASDWASRSAIVDYDIPSSKVITLPFGANLANPPTAMKVADIIRSKNHQQCQLVSIGVDWVRKGMQKAVDLAAVLNARGVPTHLTIVGCVPPDKVILPDFVTIEGFIDKGTDEGARRFETLLEAAHFHVLFSSAECFGVVFAEANAYGLPNIASDVGGVETAVRAGSGGWLFPDDGPTEIVADQIEKIFSSKERWAQAAELARIDYDTRLNWDVSGKVAIREIERVIAMQSKR